MNYNKQISEGLSREKSLNDLRNFPVTASDILPKGDFKTLVGLKHYPIADALLRRHDSALLRQSLNL